MQSMENNRRCGGVEGWPGQRWSSASQRSVLSRAASSRRREQVVPVALEEEDEILKVHADQVDNALHSLRPIGPHVRLQKCGIYLTHVFYNVQSICWAG